VQDFLAFVVVVALLVIFVPQWVRRSLRNVKLRAKGYGPLKRSRRKRPWYDPRGGKI
jgi:hypothetical protein